MTAMVLNDSNVLLNESSDLLNDSNGLISSSKDVVLENVTSCIWATKVPKALKQIMYDG